MTRTKIEILFVKEVNAKGVLEQVKIFVAESIGPVAMTFPLPNVGDRVVLDMEGKMAGSVTNRCLFYIGEERLSQPYHMVIRAIITLKLDTAKVTPSATRKERGHSHSKPLVL